MRQIPRIREENMSKTRQQLETAAIRAHQAGRTWGEYWQAHWEQFDRLPAADRQPAIEIALQIVVTGETAGMMPVANSLFGWDEADADQAAPVMVVSDTDTTARCLWSPGQAGSAG